MIHHYITKYTENEMRYAEAWLQINLFWDAHLFLEKKNKNIGHRVFAMACTFKQISTYAPSLGLVAGSQEKLFLRV